MSAREELFRRVSGAFVDESKANGLLDAYRAEVLREVADDLEAGLVKDPCNEAEEHVNDCYRQDIWRLRRMAEGGAS
jgi:hypothetical protein